MDNVKPTSTLHKFPPIPRPGRITICEAANMLKTIQVSQEEGPVDFSPYVTTPESYHHIMGISLKPVVPSKIPSIRVTETRDNFIVPTRTDGLIKGIWNAWFDTGFIGAIKFLQSEEKIPRPLKLTVESVLNMWDLVQKSRRKLIYKLYPHYGLETEDLIQKYSTVREWKTSWIRALSWHSTCSKLAIALKDDSIRILTNGVYDGFPYVKSPDQTKVSSLSWKPYSERELAVGVEGGVVIWELDGSLKPPSHRSRLLTANGHSPVTCVQYSPNGRHLVSCSSLDTSIYVWCTSSYEPVVLHRYGGGGVPLIDWSPTGTQLFSTTPSSTFKVWSAAQEWAPVRWRTARMDSHVEAMCWSPDGGLIIFASGSVLFSIIVLQCEEDFVDAEIVRTAIPVYDLRPIEVQQEETGDLFKIGGEVRQIVMSPCGTKLALIFSHSEVVALFRVQQKSPDLLYPLGFVRGYENEYPVAIEFQRNMESGALLTIAWSSSRLQHFPMLTSHQFVSQKLYEEDQIFYFPSGSASFGMSKEPGSSFVASPASRTTQPTTSNTTTTTSSTPRRPGPEAGDFHQVEGDTESSSFTSHLKIFSSPTSQ